MALDFESCDNTADRDHYHVIFTVGSQFLVEPRKYKWHKRIINEKMHHSILLRNNDVISISNKSFIAKILKNQILIFVPAKRTKIGEYSVRLTRIWMKES